ncbi:MAG: D-alanine--D-alanine ligase family protein [Floccifex sp.]
MLKLGVVFGGQSSEYSVSLHSTASFLRQIREEKYEITKIGIDPEGHFYVYSGSIDDLEHDHWKKEETCIPCAWTHKGIILLDGSNQKIELDCVFPVVHGKNCEDGTLQGLFEVMNIHYVGCDTMSSAISMDKEIMHILCDEANIPCAKYVCLNQRKENPSFEDIQKEFGLPWIVKPCNAGSSYGVSKVSNQEEFDAAVKEAFFYDGRGKILVEEMIDGFEIGCAVMGNDKIMTGSCDEIEITRGIFDFEGKYAMDGANIYCPARISKKTFDQAQDLAKRVYVAMNCAGLARVDMFVTKEKKVILNELNTLPGFTDTSRYPSMMKEAGLSFPDLIDQLIELAMQRVVGAC